MKKLKLLHKDNIKKIINFMNKAKDHVSIYQKNLS